MINQGVPRVPAALAPQGSYPARPQEEDMYSAGAYVPPRLAVPAAAPKVVRGQMQDAPAAPPAPPPAAPPVAAPPPPLTMPGPGSFGVLPAEDWTTSLARLEKLGLAGFQAQQQADGSWKFICQLRTARAGQYQRIESPAVATKTAAIRLALVAAERWATAR